MITLGVADLIVIACRTLGLDTAAVLDLLDVAAAEGALDQARPALDPGAPGTPADVAGQAAVLLDALVRCRPLRRGNRQVALAAMLQFLALNGVQMDPGKPGQLAALVAELAVGAADIKTVAERLASRLRPAAGVEEASMPSDPASLIMRIKKATTRTQPKGMIARFTDRARRVCVLAQEEARLLRRDQVGTEHLLLALLYEGEGIAARALDALGVSRELVLVRVAEMTGHGQGSASGPVPFSPPARKALELSLREALALGHHYIGTEHILLGLLNDRQEVAVEVLARLGADRGRIQEQVAGLLAGRRGQAGARVELAVDLADTAERLTEVRQQKAAAFDAGDLDRAAALRDLDRQLLADKERLEKLMTRGPGNPDVIAENELLHLELERLHGLLRQHGIDPDTGTARTA